MYNTIKHLSSKIIPKSYLIKHEQTIRSLYFLFYRGNTYHCNICNKGLKKFIGLIDDKLCPNCGSSSRNRRLFDVLTHYQLDEGSMVLDFSPSRCFALKMKENEKINYISTDYAGEFVADKRYNITDIDLQDETCDFIICYHVLEHIENDKAAISELYRILKKNGICFIQTPFKEGDIYENLSIKSEEERLKHFGQKDHVRIYSVDALKTRLENEDFSVHVEVFRNEPDNMLGLSTEEKIFICRKNQ